MYEWFLKNLKKTTCGLIQIMWGNTLKGEVHFYLWHKFEHKF